MTSLQGSVMSMGVYALYAVDQSQRTVPSDQSEVRAHGKEKFREIDSFEFFEFFVVY